MQVDLDGLAARINEAIRGPRADEWRFCVGEMVRHIKRTEKALEFYAALGPDEVPYADTINDPPDVGRVAREALDAT